MVAGTLCVTNAASRAGIVTVTATFGVRAPNTATPSCTIRHWKLYVPAVAGEIGRASRRESCSVAMLSLAPKSTRANPHVVLLDGFCDASRKLLAAVHV